MADEEERNANEMDERANHDLSNVQSKNSISNPLPGGMTVRQNVNCTARDILCGDPSAFGRYRWRLPPRPTQQK